MNVGKNILGGFFKPLTLGDIIKKIKGKFVYMVRDDTIKYLNDITRYVGFYPSDKLTDPPRLTPGTSEA